MVEFSSWVSQPLYVVEGGFINARNEEYGGWVVAACTLRWAKHLQRMWLETGADFARVVHCQPPLPLAARAASTEPTWPVTFGR